MGIDIINGWPVDRGPLKLNSLDSPTDPDDYDPNFDPDKDYRDEVIKPVLSKRFKLEHVLGSLLVLRYGYDLVRPDYVTSGDPDNWTFKRSGTHAWLVGLLDNRKMLPILEQAGILAEVRHYKAVLFARGASVEDRQKLVSAADIERASWIIDKTIPYVRQATNGRVRFDESAFAYSKIMGEPAGEKAQYIVA